MGLSRQRSGVKEESVCYDEERGRERGLEEEVEMAADTAKQRGLTLLNHLLYSVVKLRLLFPPTNYESPQILFLLEISMSANQP